MSSVVCDRCEVEEPTVGCLDCGKALGKGEHDDAVFCDDCLTAIHIGLGKHAANHRVIPFALLRFKEESDQELKECKELFASSSSRKEHINSLMEESRQSCEHLQCEVKESMEELRTLIASREADMLSFCAQVRDSKLELLSQLRDLCHVEDASKLLEEIEVKLRLPLDELKETQEQVLSLFDELRRRKEDFQRSSSPSILTSCGFLPDTTSVKHTLSYIIMLYTEEVKVGEKIPVEVVGRISDEGIFWARVLPDAAGLQVVQLRNISSALAFDISQSRLTPLSTAHRGQLCCACYPQDQSWYRVRVVDIPKPGRATVFFLDFGGSEDYPLSSLFPLAEKFQVYPFQLLQCCFTEDPSVSFKKREVKWCFRDNTQRRQLSATITKELPSNVLGRLRLVQLHNENFPEAFDVGVTILAAAESSAAPREAHPLLYRDFRYKDQPQRMIPSTSAPVLPPSSEPPSTSAPALPPSSEPPSTSAPALPPSSEPPSTSAPALPPSSEPPSTSGPALPPSSEPPSTSGPALPPSSEPPSTSAPVLPPSSEPPSTSAPVLPPSSEPPSTSGPALPPSSEPPSTSAPALPPSEPSAMPFMTKTESQPAVVPAVEETPAATVMVVPAVPGKLRSEAVKENTVEVTTSSSQGDDTAGLPIPGDVPKERDIPPPVESAPTQPPEKPQARVKPLKLLPSTEGNEAHEDGAFDTIRYEEFSSESPGPDSSTTSMAPLLTSMESLPPDVKFGAYIAGYVTTSLSKDGVFWVQLMGTQQDRLQHLMDKLQQDAAEVKELYTPVFFSEGDFCVANFSEDGLWYRAKIEGVANAAFTVRFLDFGNCEEKGYEHLRPLRSEFRVLPLQGLTCSISTKDHVTFSQTEMDKFEDIVPFDDLVTLKVLRVVESVVFVQLLLEVEGRESIDLSEEIYTADMTTIHSIDFSLHGPRKSSFEEVLQSSLQPINWAEHMDAIESPHNDGFLTLSGVESDHSTAGAASLVTPYADAVKGEGGRGAMRSHKTGWNKEQRPQPVAWSRPTQEESYRERRGQPPSGSRGPAPRLDMGLARRNILSNLGSKEKRGGSSETERGGRFPERGPDRRRDRSPPRVPPVDYGQQLLSGTIGEQWDKSLTPPPRGSPISTPRGRKSPEAEAGQIKLYIKYMPHQKGKEDIVQMFSHYGNVALLEYHSQHRDKLYLIMDIEGGRKAMAALNGVKLMGSPRPLSVQTYKSLMSPSPSPPWQSPSGSLNNVTPDQCIRLFVKNVPSDKTEEDLTTLFSTYGTVYEVVPHPSRRGVIFVYMDPEGGQTAIQMLHGKPIAKNSRALIVDVSHDAAPHKFGFRSEKTSSRK